MRKALVILAILIMVFSGTAAFAADGVIYRDDELGFSFVMPSDYEYYGDVLHEAVELTDMDTEGLEKQPMYMGYDSNINVVYEKLKDEFDTFEKALQNDMKRDEIDLYLFEESVQQQYVETLAESAVDYLGNTILNTDIVDYGGKLCAVVVAKGQDAATGIDYYQQQAGFLYKDYFIIITYTKVDIYSAIKQEVVFDQFEECFSTLTFDTVPSDKEAKLNFVFNIDWEEAGTKGVIGGIGGAAIGVGIVLVRRKRSKKQAQISDAQDKGDNDGL